MGHWVEAGDGYSWVEDPVEPVAPVAPQAAPVDTKPNLFGPAAGLPALVGPQAPAAATPNFSNMPGLGVGAGGYGGVNIPDTAAALGIGAGPVDPYPVFTKESDYKTIAPSFLKDIAQTIDKNSYDPAAYTHMVGGDETGSGAYSQTESVMRDIGGNMQGAYDPNTGKLQAIYYKDQSKGGYWNPQGQFIPYQKTGGGFGSFLSGMFSGIKDLATSDMVKTIAPMVISGGLGGATGIGNLLGVNPIVGGAIAGGGTAALTGGDVLKGALMGGVGGAGNVNIGDTGVNIGQVSAGLNVAKNLESGNILGALTGAANLTGAGSGLGNTEIGDTGYTLGDLAKNAGLAKAVLSGNPQAVIGAITSVAQAATQNADTNAAIADYTTPGAATTTADAGSNLPALNSDVMQQLTAAFTNPQDLSNTPSVQVASADPASALAALQETQAPTAEQATVPTQAEQQPAVNELVKQLETTQTPQTVEQIMAAEPAPAVSQVTTPAEAAMTQVTPAAQEVATVNTPEEAATQVQDLLKQIGVGSNPEAQQAITDLLATNPAPAVNNTETTGVFQDIPADFEQPGTTQTLEQILEGEPTPAVSQVEIPATQETTPEVQKLIDEAVNNQQTTTAQDKSDVNTQTQELLNILSGGTDNGTTIEEPAVYPKEIIRPEPVYPDEVYPDEVYPKEVLPPEPDYPEEIIDPVKTIIDPEGPPDEPIIDPQEPIIQPEQPREIEPEPTIDPAEVEEPRVAIDPTEDDVQDFLDRHVLDQPEEEVLPEETVSPTEDVVQDFIDRHVLDQPDEEIIPQDTSPNEDDVQEFIDRHILDQPENEVIPQDTSPDEEDVQDFIDRHILDEPDTENDTSPDEDDVQDFLDRHILDEPDVENDISPDEEDVQDFLDRHILDEPPEETEDGESPTEQDVIDYVDDHPDDGEEDEDGEDEDEESKGGGTGKVNIGGGTKTNGGTTVTPKSTATTKPAVDTAEFKKLLAGLLANQQFEPSVGDVAHIKSNENLFGAIPGTESPASSANEDNYDPVSELLAQGDEEYASGGHVDDLDVEALLQILRS